MTLADMIATIEAFAPPSLAMGWDNIGLLSGDPGEELRGAVLCLDVTEEAFRLCLGMGANLCISHHPFLFDPIRRIDYGDPRQKLLTDIMRAGIAVYAAHTNLDACRGGVNDTLAVTIGLLPESHGTGGGGNPAGIARTPPDLSAQDIWRIFGTGGDLTLFGLYRKVTRELHVPGCHINFDTDRPVRRVIVLGGSYDSEWNAQARGSGADAIVCGEMKHRDMVYFGACGIAVLAAGHDATERVVLPVLAEHLRSRHPEIAIAVCRGFDYNKVVF